MRVLSVDCQNSYQNFNYFLIDEGTGQAVCFDPFDGESLANIIEGQSLTLRAIVNTHEHWDHTRGNAFLVERYGADVWSGPREEKWAGGTLRLVSSPGHTMGHVTALVEEGGRLERIFSGDTLFYGGVGNCHNGGDPQALFETLSTLYASLDERAMVYPGHDYLDRNLAFAQAHGLEGPGHSEVLRDYQRARSRGELYFHTLGRERSINPFLRLGDDREAFLALRKLRDAW